jgi:DNA-directed RNA polymerase subunit M
MKFCPKCGAIVLPKKDGKKAILACSCGWSDKRTNAAEMSISEEVKQKEEEIEVISDEDTIMPETEAECEKCGNDKAYYWFLQTRAGDEPETKFFRCTKCKYTWRDYS